MNWQKNDWNLIIDQIHQKTLDEMKLQDKIGVLLVTNYFHDRVFYDLLKYKNPNFNIYVEALPDKLEPAKYRFFDDLEFDQYSFDNGIFAIPKMDDSTYNLNYKKSKYLLCSAMNRNRLYLIRDFEKNVYHQINFFPFSSLFESDLLNIANICSTDIIRRLGASNPEKYKLRSEEFSAEDLEWVQLEDEKNDILISGDPSKHRNWHVYHPSKQKLIARLWAIEKQTRWKVSSPIFLDLEINR